MFKLKMIAEGYDIIFWLFACPIIAGSQCLVFAPEINFRYLRSGLKDDLSKYKEGYFINICIKSNPTKYLNATSIYRKWFRIVRHNEFYLTIYYAVHTRGRIPRLCWRRGLCYGAIFSIIDGTNCSPKAVLAIGRALISVTLGQSSLDCRANVGQFNHQCFERSVEICELLDIEVKKLRIRKACPANNLINISKTF
jgi:hypothetical protein